MTRTPRPRVGRSSDIVFVRHIPFVRHILWGVAARALRVVGDGVGVGVPADAMFRDGDPLVVAVVVSDVVLAAARVDGGDASGEETPLALPPHGDASADVLGGFGAGDGEVRGRRVRDAALDV